MAKSTSSINKFQIEDFDKISDYIKKGCEKLGAHFDNGASCNARFRGYNDERGYLAITRADQDQSGGYSGLSFVVFPIGFSNDEYTCVITICIGTDDLGEDEELAELPWFRRSYTALDAAISDNERKDFFIKTSFSDAVTVNTIMVSALQELEERDDNIDLSKIAPYYRVITAAKIVKFTSSQAEDIPNIDKAHKGESLKGTDILLAWLAQYAKIRGWDYRKGNVFARQDNLISRVKSNQTITEDSIKNEVSSLLCEAHYVVLQGAPGTGKTRMANRIATAGINNEYFDKVYFTQFHAETTYSEFVGGIRPVLTRGEGQGLIQYEYHEGIFTELLKTASANKNKKYLLIIDEINRANLKNVLGPVFYLFERSVGYDNDSRVPIEIETKEGIQIKLSSLPENIYVIATMNTSDRSLAMVDFALRRRFAWYTLLAYDLVGSLGNGFHSDLFNAVSNLFDKYATDEELPLQPGHSYFIAPDKDSMRHRMIYEIMPLMKEYFAAGLMLRARDEFAEIYYQQTGLFMYR